MRARIVMTISLTIIAAVVTAAGAGGGVSPGEPDRFAAVETRCPTFSWEASPGADAFELVAFVLPQGLEPDQVADEHLTAESAVLYATVPGGATAWTPSAERCLAPGGRYAWFVRAVTAGEPSAWSEGRYLAVPAVPTVEELARAVDLIRQWEAANGGTTLPLSTAAAPAAVPAAVAAAAADSGVAKGSAHPKSVPTAVATVRGDSVDTVGELYGVVGTSASLTGAGLGAANTAGGPDLVLDGSADGEVDTLISERGIDRPAPDSESFVVRNSGGGTIVLEVEGTLEATALDCPGCVTDTELAAGAVTSAKILDGAVTSAKIADGGVRGSDLADGAVTNAKIAAGAVGSTSIHGNAVTSTHIANGAVTSDDILNGTITAADVDPTSSLYVSKSQLYEREHMAILMMAGTLPVAAYCDDANDLPIAASCVIEIGGVLNVRGTEALDWDDPVNPAGWECLFANQAVSNQIAKTRILCISVP